MVHRGDEGRRWGTWAGSVFLAVSGLVACRGVLGIETVDLETDAEDAAAADGSLGGDGGAPPVSGPDGGVGAVSCGGDGLACSGCCRNAYKQANPHLEELMQTTGCICAGANTTCQAECGSTSCASQPTPPEATRCVPCLNAALKSSACTTTLEQCRADANCKALTDCLLACP